ncbi:MAG: 6-phosphofructokinase [Actinobacteria bacterium]|nr:6-phosphofructokinase [Actinomycetota bacterium]
MRIGVLTGGGDCPGLNAVLRAIVRRADTGLDHTVIGFRYGWRGLIEGATVSLDRAAVRGTLPRGGTILGSSRTNPYKTEGGVERVLRTLQREAIDALIAIGGEDTLGVARKLGAEGVRAVGVPKTIDNDLSATEVTFGFDTAVQTAVDAIDRLHTTAESHDRVMVVEVMGRHAGWVALHSGLAGGANAILIPERSFDVGALCDRLEARHARGENASIVVVAEGATPVEGTMTLLSGEIDEFGHVRLGGIGGRVADEIRARTGFDTRTTILGHVLRGGTPTAFDRILASRFGVEAADAAHDGDFATMVALQCDRIVRVPIEAGVGGLKLVDPERYALAEVFLG